MYQKSFKTSRIYLDINCKLNNILYCQKQAYINFKLDLSELKREFDLVKLNSHSEEDVIIYEEHDYEYKRIEIHERLNIELSNLVIQLYTIFESKLKKCLNSYKIRKPHEKEPNYKPYLDYITEKLNIEIPQNFKNEIDELRKLRNKFVHTGIDLTVQTDEIDLIISNMTKQIGSFFDILISFLYDNMQSSKLS